MLPNNLHTTKHKKLAETIASFIFLLATSFYLWPGLAYSQTTAPTVSGATANDMLTRIATQVPALMYMITAIAYVLGMYFMVAGALKLKEYGESRTMMSQQNSLKGPLTFLVIGALLLYLPTAVNVGLSTFWTEPNPYAYLNESGTGQWGEFWNVCFVIVQLVGTISFIRGLVILSHLGGHGGQPGTFARGLTHIIAGVFCINIYQFVQVIFSTFGITT